MFQQLMREVGGNSDRHFKDVRGGATTCRACVATNRSEA
jgi:hypothetical protein